MVGNREPCTSNQKKRYRRLEKDKQPTQRPGSIALWHSGCIGCRHSVDEGNLSANRLEQREKHAALLSRGVHRKSGESFQNCHETFGEQPDTGIRIPRRTRNIHRRISHQSKRNVRPLPYSVCPGKRILREESPLHGRGKRYTLQRGTLLLYLGKMDIRPPHLAGKTVHRGHLPGTSPYGRLRRRSSQIPHVLG